MSNSDQTLGIYVHWPYCQAKCPYCDFNSHVATGLDHARWSRAYRTQLRAVREAVGDRTVETVFFGGGTPSLMDPAVVGDVLTEIADLWALAPNAEVTLEANPTSVEARAFRNFRESGINRVSIGIQSLRDDDLRRLGRLHNVSDAVRAVDVAHATFDRVSIDLIYARQWQSLADWEAELGDALRLCSSHLSLYQLTIEEGTVFGRRHQAGTLKGLPDDDLGADMYFLTQEICSDAGLPAYEVSNHARPGQEARHNLRYWRCQDVLGIGPGAHGRITYAGVRHSEVSPKDPRDWLSRVETAGSTLLSAPQSPEEVADEYLIMGLRVRDGISLSTHAEMRGETISRTALDELLELGLIRLAGDRLMATESGRPLLNSIIRRLAA